ncbi:retropepsin-like aspartic protease [Ureibacillus thermophilus]|uniref:Aspartyl protease n=1 Tax=Ureibacillus thermophilus TaxID=367743 RepID=A0A4V1A380_9BACL|nr:retropepsin-like aspartic protease [Ureibacillus thermophilus]QBK26320.1 hypothetical protein DKZ56_10840 [Ureibacillus thermophilus]
MQLIFEDGLLLSTIEICYKGKRKYLNRVAIDSGASHSFIDIDSVEDLGIAFENGDPLICHSGIGGAEYSFSKNIDYIKIGEKIFREVPIDFGTLRGFNIQGLIGLDILKSGEFLLDLKNLQLIAIDEKKLA